METIILNLSALRQRLATHHGIHLAREPGDYPCVAEIAGLTPIGLGYDRFVFVFQKLRHEAHIVTNDDFTLSVIHDPRTHDRQGYMVHTRQQQDADMVATSIMEMMQ